MSGSFLHLVVVLLHQLSIDLDLSGGEGRSSNEIQVGVTNQLTSQPKERLLKVVVGLGRDIVVLQILLSVESDGLGLYLTLLQDVAVNDD